MKHVNFFSMSIFSLDKCHEVLWPIVLSLYLSISSLQSEAVMMLVEM